jgi:pimeloyl-ACP methyl ester carboxylesterase
MKRVLDLLIFLSSFACLEGGRSFVIQPKIWAYKGHDIGFEVSRRVFTSGNNETNFSFDNTDKRKEPILLLNGFGVGSFHQHRLIPRLIENEEDSRIVYGVDYLGQGRSWPRDCQDGNSENEKGLIYSGET